MSGASGVGGFGSSAGGVTSGTVFPDGISATIKATTATYPDAPTDFGTPTADRFWMALYSTGEYVLWSYDVSATKWVAWEGTPVT